jgi:hypothetical protein
MYADVRKIVHERNDIHVIYTALSSIILCEVKLCYYFFFNGSSSPFKALASYSVP